MLRRALPLFALPVALVCVGCGPESAPGGADAAAPDEPVASPGVDHTRTVRAALDATGRSTARTAQKTELSQAGGPTYVISGNGAYDFAQDRGRTTVTLATAARFEEVFDGRKVYLRGTAGEETREWSAVRRSEVKARHLLRAPANDPEYTLRQTAMVKEFRKAGEESLGGIRAVRYSGALPHDALTLDMEAEQRGKIGKLRDMLGRDLPVTAEVWVDPQGRTRQIRLAMKFEGEMSSINTLTLTDLGKPVKVTIPAAATTVPSTDTVLG
ncbi:hypothetical protein [Streptomyces sp. NPDC051561]|uniref:hypothetical protein n=1 Tax=Streptomyces sp. NPDC051561 TaxID=3365658 RepID=UPI0037BA36DD